MKLFKILGILTLGTMLFTACDRKSETTTRTSSVIENRTAAPLPAEQNASVYDESTLQAEEVRPTSEVIYEDSEIQAQEERAHDEMERNQFPDNTSSEPDPDQMSN